MKFLDVNNVKLESDTSEIDSILEQEEILYAISESIVAYRKNNNLSQKELANKLNVNQTMISKLESGTYNPTFIKVHEICRELTNSKDMFIQILDNIKKAIKRVTEKSYETENKPKQYIYSENIKIVNFEKYKVINMKNGEEKYGEYQSKIPAIG